MDTGSLDYVDYDGNGIKTITTVGVGSISPLVRIHIWDGNHFETIDVTGILGYNRLMLIKKENRVYFVPVMISNKEKRKYFEFKDGVIWEIENPNS